MNGATGVRACARRPASGISVVWVEFDWGTDIFRARQIVAEKLQTVAARFPAGVRAGARAGLVDHGRDHDDRRAPGTQSPPMELRTTRRLDDPPPLLAVPGVAQVVPIGGEVKQYQVLVDPGRMLGDSVSPRRRRVRAARRSRTRTRRAACTWTAARSTSSAASAACGASTTSRETVVAVRGGTRPARQVAEVRGPGAAPKYGEGSVNAKPGVVLAVQKQPGANTLELTERIDRELARIQRTLPEGMTIEPSSSARPTSSRSRSTTSSPRCATARSSSS